MSTGLKAVLWIAGILIIGFFGLYIFGAFLLAKQQADDAKNYPKEVTYEVECGGCDLTYSNADGGTEQIEVRDKWTMTFMAQKGQHLYLSAQNDYGPAVDVRILVDGIQFKSGHSKGQYKIASASGGLP